ncbi:MAG: hypothetical protein ACOYKN_04345 [Pirellula sp.]
MLRKYLRFFGVGALVCGWMMSFVGSKSEAAVLIGPTAVDEFPSSFTEFLYLQPVFTGQGGEVLVEIFGSDFLNTKSRVRRELDATSGFFGTDTIDTLYESMHLVGGVKPPSAYSGIPVQVKVGQNNGFRPLLGLSPGQVAENAFTTQNGKLDVFPADSVFDMFLDIWVDKDTDGLVDNGEVLRNFDQSLRMVNSTFSGFPPSSITGVYDMYSVTGWVDLGDPLLGQFGAVPDTTSRINFYIVNSNGTNSFTVGAQLGFEFPSTHTVTPEPTSMALFGGLMIVPIWRKLRAGKRTAPV